MPILEFETNKLGPRDNLLIGVCKNVSFKRNGGGRKHLELSRLLQSVELVDV